MTQRQGDKPDEPKKPAKRGPKPGSRRTPKPKPGRFGDWRDTFVAALSLTGIVSKAAKAAGVGRTTAYEHKANDPAFAQAWDDAADDAADALEAEAVRRAKDGVLEPVFYQGAKCGSIRRYSDSLLMFLLKGLRPERFRDSYDVQKLIAALQHAQQPKPAE